MTIAADTTVGNVLPRLADPDRIRTLHETGPQDGDMNRHARPAPATQDVHPRPDTAQEGRVRQLAQRIASELPAFADVLQSLVEIADEQDEPRLQRYAALCRSRVDPVLSLARELGAVTSDGPAEQARSRVTTDLRSLVARAVDDAREVTGTDAIRLQAGSTPLRVRCDVEDLERSVTHLVVTALHHRRGDAPVVLRLAESAAGGAHGEPDGRTAYATLTVEAEDCSVSTGELARILSRLHEATRTESSDDAQAPARMRVRGGSVIAEGRTVRGEASRDGRLVLQARWRLSPAIHAVSYRADRLPSALRRGGS